MTTQPKPPGTPVRLHNARIDEQQALATESRAYNDMQLAQNAYDEARKLRLAATKVVLKLEQEENS